LAKGLHSSYTAYRTQKSSDFVQTRPKQQLMPFMIDRIPVCVHVKQNITKHRTVQTLKAIKPTEVFGREKNLIELLSRIRAVQVLQ